MRWRANCQSPDIVTFDKMSLILLNVLALTRLLTINAPLMEAAAILFLLRVTFSMRDATFANDSRPLVLIQSENPATAPAYARAKIR